jgi:DNA-binding NarL/FixJ family response regulator
MEGILGQTNKPITIAIVDDHPVVRYGLARVLAADPDMQVVGEAADADQAREIAEELQPDLMLLDLDIPGGGINALRKIRNDVPGVKCVILTVCESTQTAVQAMNLGAKGYILKGASARDIKNAVRTVINDASFIAPEFAAKLLDAVQQSGIGKPQSLGSREEQILAELEHGLTNKQIALKLKISERTVKHYMSLIMEKYGVTNRLAALMEHKNAGLAQP